LKRILLTNDDGIRRYGIWRLYEEIKRLGEVVVIAPESARSSTGMSLTFHKALRIKKIKIKDKIAYAVSGNPADCISLGVHKILSGEKPDLVVSGINEGDNTTLQSVYASGTVAAAVHAAILGIPAVAFSLHIPEEGWKKKTELKYRMDKAAEIAGKIAEWMLENKMPKGVDYLNVNFPMKVESYTEIKITRAGRIRYNDYVVERKDPRGKPYYWQWGKPIKYEEMAPGTDVYAVFVEGKVSVSPMRIDTSADVSLQGFDSLLRKVNPLTAKS